MNSVISARLLGIAVLLSQPVFAAECTWKNFPTPQARSLTASSAAVGPTFPNAFNMVCETGLGLITDSPVSFGIHLNPGQYGDPNEIAYVRDRGIETFSSLLVILGHYVPTHSDGRPTECYGGGKATFSMFAELMDGTRRKLMAPVIVTTTERVKKRINIKGADIRYIILVTSPGPGGHLWCNTAFWGEPYLILPTEELMIPKDYH